MVFAVGARHDQPVLQSMAGWCKSNSCGRPPRQTSRLQSGEHCAASLMSAVGRALLSVQVLATIGQLQLHCGCSQPCMLVLSLKSYLFSWCCDRVRKLAKYSGPSGLHASCWYLFVRTSPAEEARLALQACRALR